METVPFILTRGEGGGSRRRFWAAGLGRETWSKGHILAHHPWSFPSGVRGRDQMTGGLQYPGALYANPGGLPTSSSYNRPLTKKTKRRMRLQRADIWESALGTGFRLWKRRLTRRECTSVSSLRRLSRHWKTKRISGQERERTRPF